MSLRTIGCGPTDMGLACGAAWLMVREHAFYTRASANVQIACAIHEPLVAVLFCMNIVACPQEAPPESSEMCSKTPARAGSGLLMVTTTEPEDCVRSWVHICGCVFVHVHVRRMQVPEALNMCLNY